MLQAYSTTGSVSSTDPSSGTSVLQALQSQGDLGQVSSDSIAASVLQTVTA
jgi:hypothetical protein